MNVDLLSQKKMREKTRRKDGGSLKPVYRSTSEKGSSNPAMIKNLEGGVRKGGKSKGCVSAMLSVANRERTWIFRKGLRGARFFASGELRKTRKKNAMEPIRLGESLLEPYVPK